MSKGILSIYSSSKFGILVLAIISMMMSYWIQIEIIIIGLLSFLILLEIIRTIWEYIVADDHRIKMRYLIDSGLVFGLRELYVAWVMLKTDMYEGMLISLFSAFLIWLLIRFRKSIIESSPDTLEGCNCSKIKE